MPVPNPVGRVHPSEPRAVKVRNNLDVSDIHSAVTGTMNIYTQSYLEAQAIINAWDEITAAVDAKVTEIFAAVSIAEPED